MSLFLFFIQIRTLCKLQACSVKLYLSLYLSRLPLIYKVWWIYVSQTHFLYENSSATWRLCERRQQTFLQTLHKCSATTKRKLLRVLKSLWGKVKEEKQRGEESRGEEGGSCLSPVTRSLPHCSAADHLAENSRREREKRHEDALGANSSLSCEL